MVSKGKLITASVKDYLLEPAKLIIIPVTSYRVYVYHKHREELLSKDSIAIRTESWLSGKSRSMWHRMVHSPNQTNRNIVKMVNRMLDRTPWTENSLRSLPGENRMVALTGPLHAYYPSNLISPEQLASSLSSLYIKGLSYHWKHTLWCLFGLPITIPIIIVPIIPNVPGFYLAYRSYCNYKAYLGAHHLKVLLKDGTLLPRDIVGYSQLFDKHPVEPGEKERLLLDADLIARLLDHLEIHEIEEDLMKAMRQERRRLGL